MSIPIIPGINDFKSWCENNGEFGDKVISEYIDVYDLSTIARTTKRKLKFRCSECGVEYEKSPGHITRKQGCPYCKGNNAINASSDRMLINSNPDIAEEWDFEKNTEDILKMYKTSNKKVWWKCKECGHSWEAYISNRTKNNSGCPKCSSGNSKSLMEYALFLIIKETFIDAVSGFEINGMSFDIGIPKPAIIIEYQGRYYHDGSYNNYDVERRDDDKKKFIGQYSNVKYITINETYGGDTLKINDNNIYFNADNISNNRYSVLKRLAEAISTLIGVKLHVREDIETYTLSQMHLKDVEESLGHNYPELCNEWNTDKNGAMTPLKIKPKSNKKVWWKCRKCDYEWQASPAHRVVDGTGCPKCLVLSGSGAGAHLVIEGINDLKTLRPDIAEEWHTELNKQLGLDLCKIAIKSNKKVWWKCKECGKEYQDKVVYRTTRNHNCPICSNDGISDALDDFDF